jgi:flavodoxin I
MKKIALIYWPEGGNVAFVANKIEKKFDATILDKFSVKDAEEKNLNDYDYWLVGGSTVGSHVWEDANDTNKWTTFFKSLDDIDFSNKKVAFFGLGDQILYPNHFLDGLGVFQHEFEKRNAKIVGQTSTEGFQFSESEGVKDDMFYGLGLDEDNEDELTDERIGKWIEIINKEFEI